MVITVKRQLKVIEGASAAEFEKAYQDCQANIQKCDEVKNYTEEPTKGDRVMGFSMVVKWESVTKRPENIQEEYELRGEVYYCCDCPYLERVDDRRVKKLSCMLSPFTRLDSRACLKFYQDLAKGVIEPCVESI